MREKKREIELEGRETVDCLDQLNSLIVVVVGVVVERVLPVRAEKD